MKENQQILQIWIVKKKKGLYRYEDIQNTKLVNQKKKIRKKGNTSKSVTATIGKENLEYRIFNLWDKTRIALH